MLLKYYPERLGKLYLVNTGPYFVRVCIFLLINPISCAGFVFYALWKLLSPVSFSQYHRTMSRSSRFVLPLHAFVHV